MRWIQLCKLYKNHFHSRTGDLHYSMQARDLRGDSSSGGRSRWTRVNLLQESCHKRPYVCRCFGASFGRRQVVQTHTPQFKHSNLKRHELHKYMLWKNFYFFRKFDLHLPSRLIPTAIYFFSLQYWHRLRLILSIEHCWFLVHGLYWIFCWILRRKNPW